MKMTPGYLLKSDYKKGRHKMTYRELRDKMIKSWGSANCCKMLKKQIYLDYLEGRKSGDFSKCHGTDFYKKNGSGYCHMVYIITCNL